jgi:hypothetical protein
VACIRIVTSLKMSSNQIKNSTYHV